MRAYVPPSRPPWTVKEQAWLVVLHLAPSLAHQHLESSVHQPGSALTASTHTCGMTFQLHTSPPQALPLPRQSVSLLQVLPSVSGPPPPAPAFTLPPPIKSLMRP